MRARLAALGVPGVILAGIFGGSYWASSSGMIPPAVGFYLWPALVAVALLAFAIVALLLGARKAVWPLGVGFLVQLVGIGLLWGKVFDTGWQVLFYTLASIVLVLLIMGGMWIVIMLRTRWLERKMMEGLGGAQGSTEDLGRIREDMKEALSLLRKAGRGSHAIYTLPWFLVLGRPQAGKTVAIKNSGLGLPVRKDWVKGAGGTHTCDWFFTNDLIFLDTPGKWVSEGAGKEDQKYWTALLKLLRKHRGRQPLDGLVVVVPADDLLTKRREEIQEQAGRIRDVLDLMHDQLRFRFPVYLIVSKTDLVSGFTDFFRGVPAQRRHEIMGFSDETPGGGSAVELVQQGFHRIARRLSAYRTEMMAKAASRRRARRLFFFTEEFNRLEAPLSDFADVLFRRDRYHEPPVFRGFYFTSGTQGEGSPLAQAMSEMARSLGVSPPAVEEGQAVEEKRSYFLLDLFRRLMVGDRGLVSRTAMHWLRRRRDTMLVAFLPAAIALLVLLLSIVSLMLNNSLYSRVEREAPRIARELASMPQPPEADQMQRTLRLTGQLKQMHRKLDGFTVLRGWGMRRAGGLAQATFGLYAQGFRDRVLEPTLAQAEALATDSSQSCLSRIDILHSVVWLRMGRRAQWSDDLAGFDRVWGLAPEQADQTRQELLDQYGYFKDREEGHVSGSLLPGFSIARVADSVSADCQAQGSTSALEAYRQFQESCRDAVSPQQIRECYSRLGEVLRYQEQDFQRFVSHFRDLKEDLAELAGVEPEAQRGLDKLDAIDLAEAQTGECLTRFTDNVLPEIRQYVEDSGDLIEPCKSEVDAVLDRARKFTVRDEVLKSQAEQLADSEEDLRSVLRAYSEQCRGTLPGLRRLEFAVLGRVVPAYRRVSCLQLDEGKPTQPRPTAPRLQLRFVTGARAVSGQFQRAGLETKRQEWQTRLSAQEGYDEAQKRYEIEAVRKEIDAYGARYASAWTSYLRGLSLTPRRGSVASWLEALSQTNEYAQALRPAASAVAAAESMSESPFDALGRRLGSLARVSSFVERDLPEYQNLLGRVAKDLGRCENDANFWLQYRQQVAAHKEGNSLVEAVSWVEVRASTGLASGALSRLLRRPLDEAESYVRSDNLAQQQWNDVRSAYARVADAYPFAGNDLARAASLEDFVGLLGGSTGAVQRFKAASASAQLGSATTRWTHRALGLSRALFPEGSDEPEPVTLRFTLGKVGYSPAKLGEKIRLKMIQLYLGEGIDLRWKEGDAPRKTVEVPLLGDEASTYSFAGAEPSMRKGLFGRMFGSDWQPGKVQQAAKSEGAWAPLRLVQTGSGGAKLTEDATEIGLTYTLEVPLKRGKKGKVLLNFKVEGKDLGRLISLLQRGLESPPASLGD